MQQWSWDCYWTSQLRVDEVSLTKLNVFFLFRLCSQTLPLGLVFLYFSYQWKPDTTWSTLLLFSELQGISITLIKPAGMKFFLPLSGLCYQVWVWNYKHLWISSILQRKHKCLRDWNVTPWKHSEIFVRGHVSWLIMQLYSSSYFTASNPSRFTETEEYWTTTFTL